MLFCLFPGCNGHHGGDGDPFCPDVADTGEYVFCVDVHEHSKDYGDIPDLTGNSANGSYAPETLVTASAPNESSNGYFSGWYDDPVAGRAVSAENPYRFILIEDTRLYAGYCYHEYGEESYPTVKEEETGDMPTAPTINSVKPDLASGDSPFNIHIDGSGFEPANQVSYISPERINASIRMGFASGAYNLFVVNPGDGRAVRPNAVRIVSGAD